MQRRVELKRSGGKADTCICGGPCPSVAHCQARSKHKVKKRQKVKPKDRRIRFLPNSENNNFRKARSIMNEIYKYVRMDSYGCINYQHNRDGLLVSIK